MATITLDYDGRNKAARSVIEMLRNLDFFRITEPQAKPRRKSGIELAYEDVAAGRVYRASDGTDLIQQCLAD